MPALTIRNMDPHLRRKIRTLAAEHDRSMEAEALELLKLAVNAAPPTATEPDLYSSIRAIYEKHGVDGIDIELPTRATQRPEASFGK